MVPIVVKFSFGKVEFWKSLETRFKTVFSSFSFAKVDENLNDLAKILPVLAGDLVLPFLQFEFSDYAV